MFRLFARSKKDEIRNRPPHVRKLPGTRSSKLTESLKRFECPQVTYVGGAYPVFFKRGSGANLFDVDGNRYLDLIAGFGAVNLGHGNPVVLEAIRRQSKDLIQGLGDLHAHEAKIELARRLAEITPGNLNTSFFSSTGAEAVETALKTAVMATGKTGVIAFSGAYHGLGYGALQVTDRDTFRGPFEKQFGKFATFASFPDTRSYGSKATERVMDALSRIVTKARRSAHPIGAVILEPVQGRGGMRQVPADFLKALRAWCDTQGILMILDEVFTGFGRTGSMFAVDKSGIVPDLMCLGKSLANGLPLSVCIGTARVMHAWGASTGEAIHTSTFLGNPLGCAAALATLSELTSKKFPERARSLGELFRRELYKLKERHSCIGEIRGPGLFIGIELVEPSVSLPGKTRSKKPAAPLPATAKAKAFAEEALRQGLVLATSGADQNVIAVTPPLAFSEKDVLLCVKIFDSILKKLTA